MGTNYYWNSLKACPCCKRPYEEPLHIGKSSAGWVFALHVYPDLGINNLTDWEKKWFNPGEIKDEYNRAIPTREMLAIISERSWPRRKQDKSELRQWLRENQAELGPNGLTRSIIDGSHCIGHGEGTWDYIIGDFS